MMLDKYDNINTVDDEPTSLDFRFILFYIIIIKIMGIIFLITTFLNTNIDIFNTNLFNFNRLMIISYRLYEWPTIKSNTYLFNI